MTNSIGQKVTGKSVSVHKISPTLDNSNFLTLGISSSANVIVGIRVLISQKMKNKEKSWTEEDIEHRKENCCKDIVDSDDVFPVKDVKASDNLD